MYGLAVALTALLAARVSAHSAAPSHQRHTLRPRSDDCTLPRKGDDFPDKYDILRTSDPADIASSGSTSRHVPPAPPAGGEG